MDSIARWTIRVSRATDRLLRTYLARHGMKKGDLSRFIERAVQKEILAQTVTDVKRANADVPPRALEALIDEAVCVPVGVRKFIGKPKTYGKPLCG